MPRTPQLNQMEDNFRIRSPMISSPFICAVRWSKKSETDSGCQLSRSVHLLLCVYWFPPLPSFFCRRSIEFIIPRLLPGAFSWEWMGLHCSWSEEYWQIPSSLALLSSQAFALLLSLGSGFHPPSRRREGRGGQPTSDYYVTRGLITREGWTAFS